jgi:PAS domain S-box-containing protein
MEFKIIEPVGNAVFSDNDHGGLPLSDQPRQSTRRRAIEPDVRFDDSGPVESVESCLPEMRQVIDHGKVAFRDQLIDPAGWHEVLEMFAGTMRLAVALTDREGRLLGKCHNPQTTWRLARAARPEADVGCAFCLAPPEYCDAVGEAIRTGKPVIVEDQAGLAHAVVPLFLSGQALGAVLAGQVFSRYPEPLRLQRVARDLGISSQQLWHLAIHEVPVTRSTLQLYADLLMSLGQAFLGQRYAVILQKKLAQTNHRYRLFFDGVKDYALLTMDRTGCVTSWNCGAERLYGYGAAEMIGRDMTVLLPPDRSDEEGKILERIGRGERVEHFETVRVTKDGRRVSGHDHLPLHGVFPTSSWTRGDLILEGDRIPISVRLAPDTYQLRIGVLDPAGVKRKTAGRGPARGSSAFTAG